MVVHDFDWESQFCDSRYKDITRNSTFLLRRHEERLDRPVSSAPLSDAGMKDVALSLRTVTIAYEFLQLLPGSGTLSKTEADVWWTDLARAAAEGTFLYGMTAFIVAGVKA